MKILHIIREKGHELALSTAMAQAASADSASASGGTAEASGGPGISGGQGGAQKVVLLLIHDAVLTEADSSALGKGLEVFALKDDAEARGVKVLCPLVDYEGMLRLIFESDKVITW